MERCTENGVEFGSRKAVGMNKSPPGSALTQKNCSTRNKKGALKHCFPFSHVPCSIQSLVMLAQDVHSSWNSLHHVRSGPHLHFIPTRPQKRDDGSPLCLPERARLQDNEEIGIGFSP